MVCTNGMLLDRLVGERLDRASLQFSVSLQGADASEHDRQMGRAGAFAAAINSIGWLRRRAPRARLTINTTSLAPDQDLRPVIDLAADLGANQLTVNPLWRLDQGNALDGLPSQCAIDLRHARRRGLALNDLRVPNPLPSAHCYSATEGVVIDATGGCYPCMPAAGGFWPDRGASFGSAFEAGLGAVLASPRWRAFQRDAWRRRHGVCQRCHAPLLRHNLARELESELGICPSAVP